LIGCGSDKPDRAFDGQAAKVKWLTYWTCEGIDIQTQITKKDTLMYDGYERYEDPQYLSKSYKRIKTSTVERWNGEGGWEHFSDLSEELRFGGYDPKTVPENQKNKFLNAAIEDVPDINNLDCKETVNEWHKEVNKRLQDGPYEKTFMEKLEDLLEPIFDVIGNLFSLSIASFFLIGASVLSNRGFKNFVKTKSIWSLFWATVFAGSFGLIAIASTALLKIKDIDDFNIWLISTIAFIFASLVIAVIKNRSY